MIRLRRKFDVWICTVDQSQVVLTVLMFEETESWRVQNTVNFYFTSSVGVITVLQKDNGLQANTSYE